MTEWYKQAFGSDYLDLYPHRDDEDASRAVTFVARLLAGRGKSWGAILDCACGAGRHLRQLIEAGFPTVGIDLSWDLLRVGACQGAIQPYPAARADMRALPFRSGAFAVTVSLFTSFGYFEDPREDRRVLGEVARTLRPGGLYVLDFLNAPAVRAGLRPHSRRAMADGGQLIEERLIDGEAKRVVKRARREWADGRRREWTESVRLYEADELEDMLVEAGLRPMRRYGDFDFAEHDPAAPRLILVARNG
jgi:SAM-dependent methyltransferase